MNQTDYFYSRVRPLKSKRILLGAIILFFSVIALLPFDFHLQLDDKALDILFRLRGPRRVSDEIVLVYIDSRDINELGWPITRDYYGYMTYILEQSGAKVVGFDVLFDTKNTRYPDFDETFTHFIKSARNVILPYNFSSLDESGDSAGALHGTNPIFPVTQFRESIIASGFSNLAKETMLRKMPLAAVHNDSLCLSFALQIARHMLFDTSTVQVERDKVILQGLAKKIVIPTDQYHQLRLNHVGNLSDLRALSFIEVLQAYQEGPSHLDFSGDCVLIGVTAPGIAPIKVTPLNASFPAVLAHLTAVDTILQQAFIRASSPVVTIVMILLMSGLLYVILSRNHPKQIVLALVVLAVYVASFFLVFITLNVVLPFFLPVTAYVLGFISITAVNTEMYAAEQGNIQTLLQQEINARQQQLEQAQKQWQSLKQTLQSEREQASENSRASQEQLEQKRQEIFQLEKQLRDLKTSTIPTRQKKPEYPHIIHSDKSPLADVLALVDKVKSDNIPVLINGETGTGKEIIARTIHESGSRSGKHFVAVNCGALAETLLESELFGHEKGAFTGATSRRKGRFELADGGTLFLDEITETTTAFQAKLLRVLQEGTFERLGGEQTLRVDVRIIAASSANIQEKGMKGTFREDLFYRLNGFPIALPPLRERPRDIPLLAHHFLAKHGYEWVSGFSTQAENMLTSYSWPGNVRELENVIRRAAILAQSEDRSLIREKDLPEDICTQANDSLAISYQSLDEQILETLRSLGFSHASISQTAKALGNKDRGTITEYFRGMCFRHLVDADFDIERAAASIAGPQPDAVPRVRDKIKEYLARLQSPEKKSRTAPFRGLPQKYHPALQSILDYLQKNGPLV